MILSLPTLLTARIMQHAWRAAAFCIVTMLAALAALPAAASTVMLTRDAERAEAWPAVSILRDPDGKLDAAGALARSKEFEAPRTAYATLGMQPGTTWVRIPISVAPDATNGWVLQVEFALLDEVDVHLAGPQGLRLVASMGRMQRAPDRHLVSQGP